MLKRTILLFALMPLLSHGQWVQQGEDIAGAAPGDQAGYSISLSADGNTVAIGSRANDDNGAASGHARVFENQSGIWTQKGNAVTGEAVNDFFGFSISLSADGNILAVGAPDNNSSAFDAGNVKIYRYETNDWAQIGDEILGDVLSDRCGTAISLSDDGNRIAVAAPNFGSNDGQVRIFENQADEWVQIGLDIIGENTDDYSGSSVSINEDGSIVAIGAPINGDAGPSSGHVRVYQEDSGSWAQIGEDIDGGQDFYKSGSSVSINNEGNILAIGAIDNNNSGSARIYENQAGAWVQIGSDILGEGLNDDLGSSISINAEGNIFAVGAPFNAGGSIDAGHVRVFQNLDNDWVQIGEDIDGVEVDDRLGFSVSISADGNMVAIGAHLSDVNGSSSGQGQIFANMSPTGISERKLTDSFSIYPNPNNGQFTIKPILQQQVLSYDVVDMAGRITTARSAQQALDGGNLNSAGHAGLAIHIDVPVGFYLLRLALEDGSVESYRIAISE